MHITGREWQIEQWSYETYWDPLFFCQAVHREWQYENRALSYTGHGSRCTDEADTRRTIQEIERSIARLFQKRIDVTCLTILNRRIWEPKREDVPDGEWVLYAEPRESWQGLGVTPLPCELDRPAFGWQGVGAQFCMLLLLAWNDHVFKKDMVCTMSWWLMCTWLGVRESHIFHLRERT